MGTIPKNGRSGRPVRSSRFFLDMTVGKCTCPDGKGHVSPYKPPSLSAKLSVEPKVTIEKKRFGAREVDLWSETS